MINLAPEQFGMQPDEVFRNADFVVTAFTCEEGGQVLTLANRRGTLTVLPYRGLTIWDAEFDGYSLKSGRRSTRAGKGKPVGGVAFHSPWPQQDSLLAGMQRIGLQVEGDTLALYGSGELSHPRCRVRPALRLTADSAQFAIEMQITNLADQPLPLDYVCHLNYGCIPDAVFRQNLPAPALAPHGNVAEQEMLCSDDLSLYVDQAEFFMLASKGRRYVTRFSTAQFNYGLRPITQQGSQRLVRFVQPATCSPYTPGGAAVKMLGGGKMREFRVTTGVV